MNKTRDKFLYNQPYSSKMTTLPVTQIGSLPHHTIADAVAYSRKHHIPFLPERVVSNSEYMLKLVNDPGRLSCLDAFVKDPFVGQVKVQCIGPRTFMREERCNAREAVEKIRTYLDRIFDRLNATGQKILFLDEPGLSRADITLAEQLWRTIFNAYDATPGIHNCGEVPFEAMFQSEVVQIVSFDANRYRPQAEKALSRRNGKKIAWGVKTIDDVLEFRLGDLITPPCGLTTKEVNSGSAVPYTPKDCEQVYDNLMDIARKLVAKP